MYSEQPWCGELQFFSGTDPSVDLQLAYLPQDGLQRAVMVLQEAVVDGGQVNRIPYYSVVVGTVVKVYRVEELVGFWKLHYLQQETC